MPGCSVQIEFLPVIDNAEFYAKQPIEKALYCNLLMANHLGVKASDRSTRYYRNQQQPQQVQTPKENQEQPKKELSTYFFETQFC